ncbi:MAG TPA: hypothetical protein VGK99_17225 [Acidobacteriota bacterium]|jgi:hypothetical protein
MNTLSLYSVDGQSAAWPERQAKAVYVHAHDHVNVHHNACAGALSKDYRLYHNSSVDVGVDVDVVVHVDVDGFVFLPAGI